MIKITGIKECARNKNRVNLYTEDGFLTAVYLDTAIARRLKTGAELSEEEFAEMKREDGDKYAVGAAMEFLSYKMRSEREVRNKLKTKEIDAESIDRAVEQLKGYGYINDENYARLYAQELLRKFGGRIAVSKLIEKGIERGLAQRIVGEQEQPQDILDGLVERLRHKYREEQPDKRRQKMIRALMSKGFEYEDIKRAIGKETEE